MKRSSSLHSIDQMVERKISNTKYQDVVTVSENIADVTSVATSIDAIIITNANAAAIVTVATNIADILTVAGIEVEIQSLVADKITLDSLYADKATLDSIFADKATLDSLFADKIILDSLYADKAALDAVYADIVKGIGTNQPTDSAILNALTNANIAIDNAALTAADVVVTNADRAAVESIYDQFDDRYLGNKAVAPIVDNDGDPLISGALYWDTALLQLRVYDGAAWSNSLTLTESSVSTLTNKTINDISNEVAANIVHLEVQADAQTINPGDILEATNIVGDDIIKVQRHSSLGNPVVGIAIDTMSPGTNGRAMLTGVYNNYDSIGLTLRTILYGDGTGGLTTTPTIVDGNYNQPIAYVQKINGANADLIVNIHSAHESASLISSNPAGNTYAVGNDLQTVIGQVDTQLVDLEATKAELGGSVTQEFLVSTTPVSTNAATSKAYVDAQFVAGDSNVSLTGTFEFLIGAAQVFPLDCGAPSSYIPSSTTCIVNGIALGEADYTASDGQFISFTGTNPIEGDLVKLVAYGGADVYTKTQSDARYADIAVEAEAAANTTKLLGIEAGATADQIASEVPFTPVGDIAATDVQSALAEIDTEKAPLASPALTGTPTINGVNVSGYTSFKNKLINGGFDVWQRGNSFTGTSVYTTDRWFLNQGGETSAVTKTPGATNSLWEGATLTTFNATAGSLANTGRSIQQRIENVNLFKNKDVTLSLTDNGPVGQDIYCVVRQIDDLGVTLWVDTVKKVSTGDGTIKRSSLTITLPDIAAKYDEVSSRFDVIIYPQYTDGNSISISNIQLEEGSVATAFEQRPIGLELSLCQRYYQSTVYGGNFNQIGGSQEFFNVTSRSHTSTLGITFSFHQPMRNNPTITPYSTVGTAGAMTSNGADFVIFGPSSSIYSFTPTNQSGASLPVDSQNRVHWVADAEL